MKNEYREIIDSLTYLEQRYGIIDFVSQPNILILIGMCLALLVFCGSSSKPKSKRTNAFLADKKTKHNLCRTAIKQLEQRKVDEVCLYSGSFRNWQIHPVMLWIYIYIFDTTPTLFVPTANPGVEVVGASGMGKTYSIIDPLLMSAIELNIPILLYDYKGGGYGGEGGQLPLIAGFAARHAYDVRVFAPGKDYTCTINLLDFIRDSNDTTMAETIAQTLNENLAHSEGKSDNFFGPAGMRLLYSAFLLAKSTPFPDLAMAFAILQLPDLGKRLNYARQTKNPVLTVWNYVAFSQFMGFAQAGETADSILGGAQKIASLFIQPDLLPCVIGKTNVSLDLSGKEILVFQSNEERKTVFNPLIAAIKEITVNRNFAYQRKDPLVISIDEYPTIKIKESINWANQHRSKGLVLIVGYQNESQVENAYSKSALSILRTGLKASLVFNPKNEENEKKISTALGEKEVIIKNKSKSYSKSGTSTTVSEQSHLTPIMRQDDISGMRKGATIYKSPELYKGDRGNIPWFIKRVRVRFRDRRRAKKTKKIWFQRTLPALRDREQKRTGNLDLDKELDLRLDKAEDLFPMPPKQDALDTSDIFSLS